jgi:hypothetical protein
MGRCRCGVLCRVAAALGDYAGVRLRGGGCRGGCLCVRRGPPHRRRLPVLDRARQLTAALQRLTAPTPSDSLMRRHGAVSSATRRTRVRRGLHDRGDDLLGVASVSGVVPPGRSQIAHLPGLKPGQVGPAAVQRAVGTGSWDAYRSTQPSRAPGTSVAASGGLMDRAWIVPAMARMTPNEPVNHSGGTGPRSPAATVPPTRRRRRPPSPIRRAPTRPASRQTSGAGPRERRVSPDEPSAAPDARSRQPANVPRRRERSPG